MQMVFFSIITPVFNADSFINDTIQSVTNQNFQNWELLIIDDGSKDNSLQIVQDWTKKDNRIKIFTHKDNINKGVSASRNLGIKKARGEWLAFLDADDVWVEDKLEKQFDIINNHDKNLVFVYCKARVFDENGIFLDKSNSPEYNRKSSIYGAGRPGLSLKPYKWVIKRGFEAPTSSVALKAETINKYNIRFKEKLTYSEDGLFWYNVIKYGDVFYLDEPLLNYRIHRNQWNANAGNELKIGRRYLAYSLLHSEDKENYYIQVLWVTIGLKNIITYYLMNGFKLSKIFNFVKMIHLNNNVFISIKLLTVLVFFKELIMIPFKKAKKTLS